MEEDSGKCRGIGQKKRIEYKDEIKEERKWQLLVFNAHPTRTVISSPAGMAGRRNRKSNPKPKQFLRSHQPMGRLVHGPYCSTVLP